MGRPYPTELAKLSDTISWAFSHDIKPLQAFFEHARTKPLISVGVGGSSTAALFATLLHRERGGVSHTATTLDFLTSRADLSQAAVLLLTAGGNNKDIRSAVEAGAIREPSQIMCVCASMGSKVRVMARNYTRVQMFEFSHPAGRDGFLATNSLIATSILIARANQAFSDDIFACNHLQTIALAKDAFDADLLQSPYWIALYGKWSAIAAVDFESKCSETGLASVMAVDYRQFAHGRHFWLAKHGTDTTLLTLSNHSESRLARRTAALLPRIQKELPLITKNDGALGAISMLIQSMKLVGDIGKIKNIDPGRPGVPEFGGKIYSLGPLIEATPTSFVSQGVKRKVRAGSTENNLSEYCLSFVERLQTAKFGGMVLDYDGTLCPPENRFSDLPRDIAEELVRFLKNDIIVGIATGRGGSCGETLRRAIPKALWPKLLVGYYNGFLTTTLDDEHSIAKSRGPTGSLKKIFNALGKQSAITELSTIHGKRGQITVRCKEPKNLNNVLQLISECVYRLGVMDLKLVFSSHSIDIISVHTSKITVVNYCKTRLRHGASDILCIGDRGAFPGNDFELLSTPFSLSVDSISASPTTCWNLIPPGLDAIGGMRHYFNLCKLSKGTFLLRF